MHILQPNAFCEWSQSLVGNSLKALHLPICEHNSEQRLLASIVWQILQTAHLYIHRGGR